MDPSNKSNTFKHLKTVKVYKALLIENTPDIRVHILWRKYTHIPQVTTMRPSPLQNKQLGDENKDHTFEVNDKV